MTTGTVLICANHDLIIRNDQITTFGSIDTSGGPSSVTLICDNEFPVRPLIGPGRFLMDFDSFINTGSAPLLIYTALQSANNIAGLLNNLRFNQGTLFVDTDQEIWCTYFCTPIYVGSPFRIAYKNCLQQALYQAQIIVNQLLTNLHPYDEFPGWANIFWLTGVDPNLFAEPYYLRRRQLNLLNHPKTWSQMTGGHWAPLNTDDRYHWVGYQIK